MPCSTVPGPLYDLGLSGFRLLPGDTAWVKYDGISVAAFELTLTLVRPSNHLVGGLPTHVNIAFLMTSRKRPIADLLIGSVITETLLLPQSSSNYTQKGKFTGYSYY